MFLIKTNFIFKILHIILQIKNIKNFVFILSFLIKVTLNSGEYLTTRCEYIYNHTQLLSAIKEEDSWYTKFCYFDTKNKVLRRITTNILSEVQAQESQQR